MQKRCLTLLLIFIFSGLGTRCYSQTQFSPIISKMEQSLFGIEYAQQSDDARLQRIEKAVYGTTSSSPVEQRVQKLTQDMSADMLGQEIKPQKDTFAQDSDSIKENVPKADSSVNYPIVNNLEQKVLGKEYKNVDINQRLANLEQRVFKKTYSDDLNTRVDRLRQAVMPQRLAYGDDDDGSSNLPDELSQAGDASGLAADIPDIRQRAVPSLNDADDSDSDPDSVSDITVPLSALERCILKKSFPNDTVNNRLTRLELMVFNSTFSDDDSRTRFDRIASAYQAKRSSKKYDNNRFSQHMATAVELGAFLLCILAAIL